MNISHLQTRELVEKIKNENKKIAVAVEGGGLRGIVSASLLECLTDLGLRDNIVSVSGTSSGAINSAYFLNNKMDDCFELYKRMASPNFIQPKKWPDAMNLDFLFNEQISKNFPLDLAGLKQNPVDFFVTITRTDSGITQALRSQEIKEDDEVLRLLRASASAPLYSTNKEKIGDHIYNDGHVQMAIPIQPLLQSGADYIFCLMTQKRGYRKKSSLFSWLHRVLALRKFNKEYRKNFSQADTLYNLQLNEIYESPWIVPLQLEDDDFLVSKMCKDPEEMERCRQSVRRRFLGHS